MINRAFVCAAIAVVSAIALPTPVKVYAKGFLGHPSVIHSGVAHHGRHHHHRMPLYSGWIAAYPDYSEPVTAIPAQIAPAYTVVPQCTPSVEMVTVPMENGGERQITIRRCSP